MNSFAKTRANSETEDEEIVIIENHDEQDASEDQRSKSNDKKAEEASCIRSNERKESGSSIGLTETGSVDIQSTSEDSFSPSEIENNSEDYF